MKRILMIIFVVFMANSNVFCHSNNNHWFKVIGDVGMSSTNTIYTGNDFIIAGGTFQDSLYVDDPYKKLKTPYKKNGLYLLKFNKAGEVIWQKSFGGNGTGTNKYGIRSITCDDVGNIYIGGFYSQILIIESDTLKSTNINSSNLTTAFIASFDKNGNLRWAKTVKSKAQSIFQTLVYNNNSIYFAINFNSDTLIINGKILIGNKNIANPFGENNLLAKFDKDGNDIWLKVLVADDMSFIYQICPTIKDEIYISGTVPSNGFKFDGKNINKPDTGIAIFIAKLTNIGNPIWFRFAYTTVIFGSYIESLSIDNNNNLYLAGQYNSYLIFDSLNFKAKGFPEFGWCTDLFAIKTDSAGHVIWGKSFGTEKLDFIAGSCFGSNNLYISGNYKNKFTFDTFNLTSINEDLYIAQISTDGKVNKVYTSKATNKLSQTITYDLEVDDSGYVYAAGVFANIVNFDNLSQSWRGYNDGFLWKIDRDNMSVINEMKRPVNDNLFLYPNPAQNYIGISTDLVLKKVSIVEIYDLTGTLLRSYNIHDKQVQYNFDISDLRAGMYILSLKCKTEIKSLKFIKSE